MYLDLHGYSHDTGREAVKRSPQRHSNPAGNGPGHATMEKKLKCYRGF